MALKRHLYILSFLLLAFAPSLIAQGIKVSIKAPESVYEGERFKIYYVVESNKDVNEPVIVKNIEGLEILYGPSLSSASSVTFKNGKRQQTYSATSTYILRAPEKGKYVIPKGEIVLDGKRYRSDNFKIEVKALASSDEVFKDVDAFIKVDVSKINVNLNDTLTITYKLYTTREIKDIVENRFPQTNAFYLSNITRSRQVFEEEIIDGKTYKVVVLRRLLLQPRSIGIKTIPEGSVTVRYSAPTGRKVQDIWGDVYEEAVTEDKELKIESVTIRVQDLIAV